jgi:hypothetical protein
MSHAPAGADGISFEDGTRDAARGCVARLSFVSTSDGDLAVTNETRLCSQRSQSGRRHRRCEPFAFSLESFLRPRCSPPAGISTSGSIRTRNEPRTRVRCPKAGCARPTGSCLDHPESSRRSLSGSCGCRLRRQWERFRCRQAGEQRVLFARRTGRDRARSAAPAPPGHPGRPSTLRE